MKNSFSLGCWAFLLMIGFAHPSCASDLAVGVAVADITPPAGYRMAGYFSERLNTGTYDPLQAKAIVFRQGDQQAALVFCDLIGIPRKVSAEARARAGRQTGIPGSHIVIAATHSHTGPEYFGVLRRYFHDQAVSKQGKDPQEQVDYPAKLIDAVADAVSRAQKAAAPAELEAGKTSVNGLSFNRRFHMKDGTVRFNPGPLNPDIVKPAGPVDPEVGIVLVRPAKDRAPTAGLTVFALHLDTVGGTEYSADYPAVLERELRDRLAKPFVSLFGTGTCGDINHIDVSTKDRLRTEVIGTRLAQAVADGMAGLEPVTHPDLAVASEQVHASLQSFPWPAYQQARQKMAQIGSPKLSFLEQVEVCKIVDLAENYPEKHLALEVQAIRLGPDLALVTLPGEIFVELGLAIKKASPFKNTLVIELANDVPAYIPTAKAFAEGSYEVVNSRVISGSGERLVETAIRLLNTLHETPR